MHQTSSHTPRVHPLVLLAVDLVILTLRESQLQVLLIRRGNAPFRGALAVPGGFLLDEQEGLVAAAYRELAEEAGLTDQSVHLEPLGVYGEPGRDPRGRVVSAAYLAIAPQLPEPVAGSDAAEAQWFAAEQVLTGELTLAFDHQRVVSDGVERARVKLENTSLATAFCGPEFTISELQQVYEAVWGAPVDPRNFYRKVQRAEGFLVAAGEPQRRTQGRPARVFRSGPRTVLYPPINRGNL